MAISTKKPPRTPEEFIGGAIDERGSGSNVAEKVADVLVTKPVPDPAPRSIASEPYIRDKKFLLSIPSELHKLAVEKAKERKISLHEFILKAMDKTIREI